ncbi:MAG TPA: transketolase [Candidatus Kapabacteria bacterium]|nr:transketolase [Candidatus Kapabacteria bacterium]
MASFDFHIYPLATGFHGDSRPVAKPELVAEYGYETFSPFKDSANNSDAEIASIAREIRRDIIRALVEAKSGHSGGPLGSADIFATLYFGGVMNYDPKDPWNHGRDRFILSAGHMCPVLYSTLANAGFFPKQELLTLRKLNSRLQGHPGRDMGLPGIESSTGSLGQGFGIAVGMAIADKLVSKNSHRVFALTGDGELQEGEIWESAMAAANYKLDNLTVIVDRNHCQIDGRTDDVMEVDPVADKWAAFGFHTIHINGHNISEIRNAFAEAKTTHGKPTCIVAETYMGHPISFMNDDYRWHGKPPNKEQAIEALKELA